MGVRVFWVFWRGVGGIGRDIPEAQGMGHGRIGLRAVLAAVCNIASDFSPLKRRSLRVLLSPPAVHVLMGLIVWCRCSLSRGWCRGW